MMRDPNKRYPYQPGFFTKPDVLGYFTIPVITSDHPALYGCIVTLNGYGVASTPNGTREECEILGFNGMQLVARDMEREALA